MDEHVAKRNKQNVEECFQRIAKFFLGTEDGRGRDKTQSSTSLSPSNVFLTLEVGLLARNFGKVSIA